MHRSLPLLLTLLLLLPGLAPVVADEQARTPQVTLTLLAGQSAYVPGQPLVLGLRFDMIPHWHVYWRNPGDSGEAPRVAWDLPDGWRAGDLQWPVPQRIPVGPLVNYGYEHRVTLLSEIVPARDAIGDVTINADVDWLVCREECIPQQASLSLTLPPAGDAGAIETDEAFEQVRAHWPVALPAKTSYHKHGSAVTLRLADVGWTPAAATEIWFATYTWGPVSPSAAQHWSVDGDDLVLSVPTGDAPPDGSQPLAGLLVVSEMADGQRLTRGFDVTAQPAAAADSDTAPPTLLLALGLALLGGLLLNLMPCVLPVLSIKVMGLLGHRDRGAAAHGIAYSVGVLLTFLALAALLVALRSGGAALGWGFQLQQPLVVVVLMYLMLVLALNLSGVFAFSGRFSGVGQGLTARPGVRGSFATGVLAVIVASPCTAPFMGVALGYALTRPPLETLLVFAALAAGFALPMLLLSLRPGWLRLLPAPGAWMERLRQALAFPLYATAAWLLWVLDQQVDSTAMAAALAGAVLLAFGLWWGAQDWRKPWRKRLPAALLLLGGLACAGVVAGIDRTDGDAPGEAGAWSEQRVNELRQQGRAVLVNFTAAWCITCKVNERVALSTPGVRAALAAPDIAYLKADWTRRDPAISAALQAHGRSGVPLYLLYPAAPGEPRVLPQLLTEGLVLQALATVNKEE